MSNITDAIIYSHVEDSRFLEPLPKELRPGVDWQYGFCQLPTDGAGGGKVFTSAIYAAAFNHIDIEILEKWFEDLNVEDSVLIYREEYKIHPNVLQISKD